MWLWLCSVLCSLFLKLFLTESISTARFLLCFNIFAGMGLHGNLARSVDLPYMEIIRNEDGEEKEVAIPNVVQNHFLTPQTVLFEDENNDRSIIAVACGACHMLVVARDNGDPEKKGKLFSCGLNNYGQLGHGDYGINRHALKLVRTNNIFYIYIRHV
jgi:hypothetical protein